MFRSTILHHFARQLISMLYLLLVLTLSGSFSFANAQTEPEVQAEPLPAAPNQIYLPLLQSGTSDAVWSDITASAIVAQGERLIIPQKYRTVSLNVSALQQLLQATPLEQSTAARSAPMIFSLPLPDGTFGRFQIVESPIMAPELAAKFPQIKTYAGQGIDDRTATVRFDWTPAGFHAMILSATDTVFIDPYSRGDTTNYISYFKRDFLRPAGKSFVEASPLSTDAANAQAIAALVDRNRQNNPQVASGGQLRTYRLAMAANVEYTTFHSLPGAPNAAAAMAAIVTTVNRVDGIYEREVAVRLVLVANNNLIIYTAEPDPYDNSIPLLLLTQNQANLDMVIGNGFYDIGHVFTTGGGGLAGLGVVCNASQKGHGETGSSSPVGDPFDVDYVAHEVGHQFGGNHTFNNDTDGSCNGNRNASTAYEPGSGSTIQAYAGICSPDNLQPNSDPYFSTISFDEIVAYTTLGGGNSCPVTTATGNAAPVVNAGTGGFTIPRQTPFTLTGSATDANGDALTYGWEEFDPGDADGSLANNPLEAPFFRFFPPVTNPSRTFPKMSDIVNNTTTIGEILPNVSRALNFRLTARDNKLGGGGVDYASITFNVTTAAGPFLVTAPNTAVTWTGGGSESVTWNVASTNVAPVSCATVNILLSTDGGFTYPTTLATGVPNNGSANVPAPNISTTTARVQVVCATSIFFDISNANFTITPAAATGTIIIRKVTSPAGGTGFGFTSNVPGAATFSLNHNQNRTINSVAVGSYTVTEDNPTGYSLTNLVCTDPTNNSTVNVGTRTATINLAAGETVDCTFTNTQTPPATGTIIIRKVTSPAGGTGFGFTSNVSGAATFTLNHNQNRTINSVAVGSYTVTENNPTGYSLTNLVCTDPTNNSTVNVGTRTATINLAAGETVDCTFTNTQTGAGATIVISSDENGSVPGLSFRDEDLMAYNPNTGLWSLVFDGSDVGLGNVDVDGFAFLPNGGGLLLSVDKDFTLSGFGQVDESDIIKFIPTSYGPTTKGSYVSYFDGSDVGLDKSDEDVDAIDFDANGNLLISVDGAFKAQSVSGNDEDLFVLTGFTPGANTTGTWGFYFDGSDVGLSSSGEDIFGLWADHANHKLYLTTHDNFSVPGASGDEDDIFVCLYGTLGSTTTCTFTVFWNGDTFGFDDDAIDGLSIGTPPTLVTAAESSDSAVVDDTVEFAGDDINEVNPLDGEEIEDEAVQTNPIFLPLVEQ